MKTMDCGTFGILIENHESVDLIDIRPRERFSTAHIPGARSVPLSELSHSHLFLRGSLIPHRVYIISDDRSSASAAVGILTGSNEVDAVIVDGGMSAWMERGLPIRRARSLPKVEACLRVIAAVLAIACVGFALSRPLTATLCLIAGTALLFKAQILEKAASKSKSRARSPENSAIGWDLSGRPKGAVAC